MNIKNELEAMNERMFADELLNKILAAHKKELADTGFEAGEQSCAEAGQTLAAMLNEGQKKKPGGSGGGPLGQPEVCLEIQFYARRLRWLSSILCG